MARNDELYEAICAGRRDDVDRIVRECVERDGDIVEMLNDSMIPAMASVGEKFSRGEAYVPEMLIAARAMQAGLDVIEPLLTEMGHEPLGKVAIGTVKGDLHDIGKNLVAMMLKGAGYKVVDLGVDCDVANYEQAVAQGAQAVLCSALLTTTMPYMEQVAARFADNDDVKVIIGGAPVTQEYADEIGADGYSNDANTSVATVGKVINS